MKAFIAQAPFLASFKDIEVPEPKSGEVLIKIKYAGICGTDFAIYSGESSFVKNGLIKYPVRFGHEWSGLVVKTGNGVVGFKAGDKVVGDNFVACGQCESCLGGNLNECVNKHHVGTIDCWDGCFAEYMVMPQRHLYKIPERVPMIEAALMEPLSVAYGGIRKCDITSKSTVVVIGTGPIGMSAIALAKYKGACKIVVIGRNNKKLDVGLKVGATMAVNINKEDAGKRIMQLTGNKGADFVLEASGVPNAVMQAVAIATQKGLVALLGFYEQKLEDLDIDLLVSKELKLIGIMGEYGNLEAVNNIMAGYDLGLSNIITGQIPFEECLSAFSNEARTHDTRIKTIIRMPE